MPRALIALGGNVGDVRATFVDAIAMLCDLAKATLTARSSDYRTPPWGEHDQPAFINACIEIDTSLDAHALLKVLQAVERQFGRNRAEERRWGPRTLDLDILAYGNIEIDTPDLTLPHPRLFERAFVLVPLAEIAPDRMIGNRTPRGALSTLPADGITRLDDCA